MNLKDKFWLKGNTLILRGSNSKMVLYEIIDSNKAICGTGWLNKDSYTEELLSLGDKVWDVVSVLNSNNIIIYKR